MVFRVRVDGSLSLMVGEIYRAFRGDMIRSGPDANEIRLQVPPYQYVSVGLRGPDLALDSHGDDMIRGTWTELRIESVRPVSGGGVERVEYLGIRGFSADPAPLLSFVGDRLAGGIFWSFSDAPLRAALNPARGVFDGGRAADTIRPLLAEFPGILTLRGADTLRGWGGNDTLDGGRGADQILGGAGDDLLLGAAGHDHLFGGYGRDRMEGGSGNDSLSGGERADRMSGGSGGDTLAGGGGWDTVDGGGGADLLSGGAGGDVFRFANVGNDRVTDFDPDEDQLALAAFLVAPEGRLDLAGWLASRAEVTGEGVTLTLADGSVLQIDGLTAAAALVASAELL